MRARIKLFLAEFPETIWLILIGIGLMALLNWLKYYDPHSGVDPVAATLAAILIGVIEGIAITFMAWASKRTYTRDLDEQDEKQLSETVVSSNRWQPLAFYLTDRLEWVLWLVFWFYLLH